MTSKILMDAHTHFNNLPRDILSKILKCLPLNEGAKVCPVSKSWFYVWKELPELRFSAEFFTEVLKSKPPTVGDFLNILSVILLSHVGNINGFYLYVPVLQSSRALDIGPWISCLSRYNVKDITIKNVHKPPLKLSYHLFSCMSLEKLTLDNCVLNLVPFSMVLRNLKSIELENVTLIGISFTKFITSCPVLQSLALKRCQGYKDIYIAAPNLKYFTASGIFESVHLGFAKNLIGFSVTQLENIIPNYRSGGSPELIVYLADECKIENLSFGGHLCQFLTAGEIGRKFPIYFRYLKSLQLSNIRTDERDEIVWVIQMIKCCPVLEDLKISFSSKCGAVVHDIAFDPHYQYSHLRKVHLTSVTGVVLELKLIKYLLLFSPILEIMCVKRDAKITEDLKARLIKELLCYRRASPEATVVLMDP